MTTTIAQALHDTIDTLATDYAAGGTVLVLTAGQGAKYAAATVTAPYAARLGDELFVITGRSTDTLTVVGAQGGTVAANHVTGTEVQSVITAVDWTALRGLALSLEATTGLPAGASTASATTVTLPSTGTRIPITSTTTITDIVVQSAGRLVVLEFAAALTVTNGNHLKLAGDYVTAAGDRLVLLSDGTNWYELSRRGPVVDSTAPTTSAVGDAAAAGSTKIAARRDHTHGRESFATPALVLGTTAAAGSAATPIRSDSTIVAFDTTAPTTQAFGDAAAVGTATVAPRRDHKHAMPTIALSDLPTVPIARATLSSNQSLSDSTFTAIAWTAETIDTDTMHDTVTNNSRLTCKTAGKYFVQAHLDYGTNSTGRRYAQLFLNGVAGHSTQIAGLSGDDTIVDCIDVLDLAVNDYVEVKGWQNSTAALNVVATGSHFMMFRMGA
jgi:hypothetical protein